MPVPKKIGYAVVGLGMIARNSVLPAFGHTKQAKLVAVVSRDAKKAAKLRAEFKAASSYSAKEYDACLANPNVDAVYIATPQGEHERLAVRAATAGKHVLCEKPLAATVAQSANMVEACRQNRVQLMTAYRKYFEPASVYVKSLLQKQALGRLDTMHASFSELFRPAVSLPWLLDPVLAGGGPLTDLGVYCINTTRWFANEDPVEALAESWRHDTKIFQNVEQGISFRLKFPNGLRVLGSSTYSAALSSFVFIQGEKGRLSFSPAFPYEEVRVVSGKIGDKAFERRFGPLDEFALELDAFADAIRNNKPVEPDGMQGHRDVIIIQSIYESAKTGRPVAIDYGRRS
jgi:predicted dehydrogenase